MKVVYEQFYRYFAKQSALGVFSLVLGLFLFLLPSVSALLVAYSNLVKIQVGGWLICISYAIVSLFLFFLFQKRKVAFLTAIFAGTLLVGCSVWLSSTFHVTNGSDDFGYHYPAINAIVQNTWNPIWDYQGETAGFLTPEVNQSSRLNVVGITAKGQWFAAAAMASLVGKTISGNYTHLIFILAGFFLFCNLFKYVYCMYPWVACLLALVFAGNPISLSQIFCGFIDGVAASTATIFLVFYFTFFLKKKSWCLIVACFSLAFCLGTRTTFIIFAIICFLGIPLVIYCVCRFKIVPFLMVILSSALLWLPVVSNPYLYSLVKYGDPLYPQIANRLWLKDAQVRQVPPFNVPAVHPLDVERKKLGIHDMTSFYEFMYTQVFSSGIDRQAIISIKSPERFDYRYSHYHPSNGGFGPLYGLAFVLSLPLFLLLIFRRNWLGVVVVTFLSISVFFFPFPYNARYFGYAWLFPAIIALFSLATTKLTKATAGLALFISCIMLVNSAMFTHAATSRYVRGHDRWLKLESYVRLYDTLGVTTYDVTSSIMCYLKYAAIAIGETIDEEVTFRIFLPKEHKNPKHALKFWIHTLYPELPSLYENYDVEAILMGDAPAEMKNGKLIARDLSITAPSSWVVAYASPYLVVDGMPALTPLVKADENNSIACVKIVVESKYTNEQLNKNLYADFADGYGQTGTFRDVHAYLGNGENLLIGDIPNFCSAFKIRIVAKDLAHAVKIKSITYGFLKNTQQTN